MNTLVRKEASNLSLVHFVLGVRAKVHGVSIGHKGSQKLLWVLVVMVNLCELVEYLGPLGRGHV